MSLCITKPSYDKSQYQDPENCNKYSSWGNGNCSQYLENVLNYNSSGMTKFNIANTETVQDITEQAMFDYLTTSGRKIEDFLNPTKPGLIELLQTCKNLPYACDRFLNQLCNNCSQDEVAGNTGLTNLCGCYAYKKVGSDPRNVCDSTCNNNISIKNQFDAEGDPVSCNQTVCVIDDISIKAGSQNGSFDINQVCNGCVETGCVCIINIPDSDVGGDETGDDFPNINLQSTCSSHICFNSENKEIPCPPQVTFIPREKIEQNYLLVILTGLILIFLFLIMSITI